MADGNRDSQEGYKRVAFGLKEGADMSAARMPCRSCLHVDFLNARTSHGRRGISLDNTQHDSVQVCHQAMAKLLLAYAFADGQSQSC